MFTLKINTSGMDEYRYKKDGYTLNAVRLVYGPGSYHLEQFSSFALPPHEPSRVSFQEFEDRRDENLGPGINACTRYVSFGDARSVSTSVTQGNGINTVVSYNAKGIPGVPGMECGRSFSDVLFRQREYEYFESHWDRQVQHKIKMIALLVRALDTGEKELYPALTDDFPTIAKHLLSVPVAVAPREPLWR